MKGTVYKRCNQCGRSMQDRNRCSRCGKSRATWTFRVRVGRDAEGNWIEERRGGFATKREADDALRAVLSEITEGTYVPNNPITLGEYLRSEWLPATAPPHVKFETWQDRRRNLEHHVVSRLGQVRLQQLTPGQLNKLYADLMTEGRMKGEGGLSPTSVRRIHAMLRKALNDAVRWGLLRRNVVALADPPPERVVKAARRSSMQTWSADELRQFLNGTAEHELFPLWLVASMTGMRRSELVGLRWDNVDLDQQVITVRSTVVPTSEEGYGLDEDQKTDTSARTIHLDGRTLEVLRTQSAEQAAVRGQAGSAWNEHELVFPREDGHWWNPPAVSLAFRRAVRRLNLTRIRFHDLRHTHATLLLKAGVNPKVVSERLGHTSVAFTLDTYAHVMPGMQPEAAQQFSDLVLGDGNDSEGVARDADADSDDTATDDGEERS